MKKIYKADWKTYGIIFGTCFIFMAFASILGGKDRQNIVIGIIGLFLLFTIVFFIIVSRCVSISKGILTFIYPPFFMFYPKIISINQITEINRQATFRIFQGSIKSLYIFYVSENKKTKWIELRPIVFKEETMAKLVQDLKQLNPSIKLDPSVQKFMEQTK